MGQHKTNKKSEWYKKRHPGEPEEKASLETAVKTDDKGLLTWITKRVKRLKEPSK